jgi:hypothetical protein
MINRFSNLLTALQKDGRLSVIRLGNVEASQLLLKNDEIYNQMPTNAGFFGTKEELKVWKRKMLVALMNAHLNLRVVSCPSFYVCDDVLNSLQIYIPTLPYVEDIEFWRSLIIGLEGKTIGFVSYFAEEMEQRTKILKKIFPKTNWLSCNPEKDWRFIFSDNTIKGNEPKDKTWQEVYNDLLLRSLEADCDVYFLSCGCYGVPLCDELSKQGKKAIYIGGFLQLLFGLKGKRWDDISIVNQYYNKHWKYPTKKPKNAELVEGACYWGDK